MLSLSTLTNILTNIFIIIAFFMRNYLYYFIIYNSSPIGRGFKIKNFPSSNALCVPISLILFAESSDIVMLKKSVVKHYFSVSCRLFKTFSLE